MKNATTWTPAGIEIRRDSRGEIDEFCGPQFHFERLNHDHVFFSIGDTRVWLHARKSTISVNYETDEDELQAKPEPARSPGERGPWSIAVDDPRALDSDSFAHDVRIRVSGNFGTDVERHAYMRQLRDALNRAVAGPATQPEPARSPPREPTPQLTFVRFREANVRRCLKWHPAGLESWSPSDWLTAVTGELGELASLLKMRNRERDGLPGNKFSPSDKQVADEIADVLTYLDLLAAALGVDLGVAAVEKFNEVSARVGFPDRIDAAPAAVAPKALTWAQEMALEKARSEQAFRRASKKIAAPAEAPQAEPTRAALDVSAERARQMSKEGWTAEHDDSEHAEGTLAVAAASYALLAASEFATSGFGGGWKAIYRDHARGLWPFDAEWFKPKGARRNLVRAGALILAEIERLDRAALAAEQGEAK